MSDRIVSCFNCPRHNSRSWYVLNGEPIAVCAVCKELRAAHLLAHPSCAVEWHDGDHRCAGKSRWIVTTRAGAKHHILELQ